MTWLLKLLLFVTFTLSCQGNNVETRIHLRVQPATGGGKQFGASFAVEKFGGATTLYIGAPSSGEPDSNRVRPGDLYLCPLGGNENGTLDCALTVLFDQKGAIGASVAADQTINSIVVCGSQYTKMCPGANIEQRNMGICYRKHSFISSQMHPLTNPAPQGNEPLEKPGGVTVALHPRTRRLGAKHKLSITSCSDDNQYVECPSTNAAGVDIIFVVDKSGSIKAHNFNTSLYWITDVLLAYEAQINSGIVRVGFVSYSDFAEDEFNLEHYSYAVLKNQIISVPYSRGNTYTNLGISNAIDMMESSGRDTATPMIIVVTDGKSNSNRLTLAEANTARTNGITMVAVGIAKFDAAELLGIAGSLDRVITVGGFAQLASIVGTVQKVINETGQGNLEGVGNGNTTNEFSQCQLGFSAQYTIDSVLNVGAVGSFDRSGSLASYSSSGTSYSSILASSNLDMAFNATNHRESYVGYSVSSGRFFGAFGDQYVASGAPRYNSRGTVGIQKIMIPWSRQYLSGTQVLIMNPNAFSEPSSTFSVHPHGEMWQLGAYFGQAVLGIDINADSFDDLLVSAPLYFSQNGYDQGRVFVYMNDIQAIGPGKWTDSSFQPAVLSGQVSGGRFGSTISAAGDLDRNGYSDVVIGAPMEESTAEESGAVYIYYLSSNGISDAHRQRIVGKSVHSPLRRFGGSVAHNNRFGSDVNNDGYPDVYVGAPSSDAVVVLRSRPIIDVTSSLTLNPNQIDVIDCVTRLSGVCSTATFCMAAVYRLNANSETFPFSVTGVLDPLIADPVFKRLLLVDADAHQQTNSSVQVGSSQQCFEIKMRLNVRSLGKLGAGGGAFEITPRINFSYRLTPEFVATQYSAVLDVFGNQYKTADWSFKTGCVGLGGVCQHDLSAVASYSLASSDEALVLTGLLGIVSVKISLRNAGPDYAYFTKVNVTSGSLPRSKVIGDCVRLSAADSKPGLTVLEYVSPSAPLEDLMIMDATCEFTIEFDLASMASKAVDDLIEINGVVYSNAGSVALDINPENNKFTFQRLVVYSASLIFGSSASPDELFYNRTVAPGTTISTLHDPLLGGSFTDVEHTHIITSTGPLMIASAPLRFTWPGALDFLPLLYLYKFDCQPAEYCTCATGGKINSLGLATDNTTQGQAVELKYPPQNQVSLPSELTCNDVTCGTIMCTLQNMTSHSKVLVTASFKVWLPTLSQPNLNTKMFSDITVDTTSLPIEPAGQIYNRRASTTVRTYLPPEPAPTEREGTDIGAIVGGVLGGVALLCIIVLVLWKFGFFKSKYGQMTQEAREMEGNAESPYELAD